MPNHSVTPIPVTKILGEFVAQFQWEQASAKVKEIMPILMIDYFRAGIAGQDRYWTNLVTELYESHTSDRTASVLYTDLKIDISRAAFINGVASGSLDWDDSHVAAIIHPGVVIWPATFAMAEHVNATGKELLTAALVGYETAIRIGMSIQPEHSLRGFQGTPTCGVFGAAAACARLLKLSPEKCRDALGIAATFSCGISQFFVSGSDIKRFHSGKAAANGIESALLAHMGLTGPHDAIEGTQGFARAFSDRFDPETVITDLSQDFVTEWISLKPHVGSVRMQAAIEAASRLSQEGLKSEQIQSITIGIHGAMVSKLASNQPVDVQQAQLSTPFAVAMALIIGESRDGLLALSIDDYESNIQDPIVRDLCSRTTCVVDSEVESLTTQESVAGRVTCHLKDGTTRSVFIASPKGCPENPMSIKEVADRFQGLGASVFLKSDCDNWLHHALHVQDLQSITPLTNLRKQKV